MKSYRQNEIVHQLNLHGSINTAEMAQKFGVSPETIRRDLDQLEKMGILKKNYGGAVLQNKVQSCPEPLKYRRETLREVKVALSAHASGYISEPCTIALDAGSTILELCPFLKEKKQLTIICSDILSANELLHSSNKLYMMGGFLTPEGTSSGTFAREFFNNITSIDFFLFSSDGASLEDGLSSSESGINDLKKHCLKKAKMRIAIIDHSKFTRNAFYKMCDFTDIDILITDSKTPADIINSIRQYGTQVDVIDV